MAPDMTLELRHTIGQSAFDCFHGIERVKQNIVGSIAAEPYVHVAALQVFQRALPPTCTAAGGLQSLSCRRIKPGAMRIRNMIAMITSALSVIPSAFPHK
jgi:hypothetical protein